MNATVDVADWDVHRVRQVLSSAGRPLSAGEIRHRAGLSHERTYASLVRMYSGDAVRIVVDGCNQDHGREWELLNAPPA